MKRTLIFSLIFCMIVMLGLASATPALADDIPTDTPTPTTVPATATPTNTTVPTLTPTPTTAVTTAPTATSKAAYSRPLLNLTDYSYDSSSSYAGGHFTLTTTLENVGQQRAYNIIVTYSSNSFQAQNSGGVGVISSLGAGEEDTLSQYFAVDSSINSTPSSITEAVEYKDANGQSYQQTFTVSIDVYGYGTSSTSTPIGRPHLVVSAYSVDSATLQPGSSFSLSMDIQNQGVMDAKNVSLNIGSTGTNSGTSSTTSSDSFLPMGSSNIKVLGNIGVGQSTKVQQEFVVSSSASAGAYPLSLLFTYKDKDGTEFTDSQVITLLIYNSPSVEVSFYQDAGTFSVGTQSSLPIQVVNLSSSSVLLGDITVSMADATLSNNQLFVGSIESGGSFTMDTDITPKTAGTDLPITVTIKYLDSFKKEQVITQTLKITVDGTNSATPDSATMATQLAQSQTAGQTPGGMPGGSASGSSTVWQIILRFFRGMIGFDSSASVSAGGGGFPRSMTTATATPKSTK
jgi:hypothetical protein